MYYLLDIGDIIANNDEYYSSLSEKWITAGTYLVGKKIDIDSPPFRRVFSAVRPDKHCANCEYVGEGFTYERTCPACLEEGV